MPRGHRAVLQTVLDTVGPQHVRVHQPLAELVVDDACIRPPCRLYVEQRHWETAVLGGDDALRTCALVLGTRHHDGHYREHCLRRLQPLGEAWQVAYVVALLGEHVAEVASAAVLALLDVPALVRTFCRHNPAFVHLTRERAISYHDCYYRDRYADYRRFPPVRFLTRAIEDAGLPRRMQAQRPPCD